MISHIVIENISVFPIPFNGDHVLDPEIQTRTRQPLPDLGGNEDQVSGQSYVDFVHCFRAVFFRFPVRREEMAKVEEDPEIGSLKVKLPAFWPDKPEAWFIQAESNFKARRITNQQAKFHLVVIALDAETLDGVLDLLEAPPAEDPYDQLKARLVQSFKISKVDKIKRALEATAGDDENPVKLADKIMALTRDASGEDISKVMFMLQMPDAVRKTMWAEPLSSWPDMKARASGLWHADRTRKRAAVCEAKVIEPEANAVRAAPNQRKRGAKFQEFAATFRQRQGGPCIFHDFFGRSASKCKDPCSLAGNGGAGRQ